MGRDVEAGRDGEEGEQQRAQPRQRRRRRRRHLQGWREGRGALSGAVRVRGAGRAVA